MNCAEVAGVSTDDDRLDVWQVLLKINLTVVPIVMGGIITWGVWQTSKTFEFQNFKDSRERFSQQDGRELRDEMQGRTEALFRGLEAKTDANASRLNSLERDTTRILTIVERLEDRTK